ncbi:MAG: hypothetical protein QG635_197 [Bacteroidota bacterium]|nr:hypothetical protein [Bacteroidota bacterium]
MLDRGIRKEIKKAGYYKFFQKYASAFSHSDYGIINLECAATKLSKKTPKQFNFKADPEALQYLKKIGISHIGLANNHSIDFGSCGLSETIENAKKSDLITFGAGSSKEEAEKPVIIEKNGIKAAIFSSTMLRLPDYNWDTCGYYISSLLLNELSANISNYRNEHPSDFIIVMLHWGWENIDIARKSQYYDAMKIINSGADMIVGTHPHVIQNIKKINGKYVFFSIGNMIFDNNLQNGMILKLKIFKGRKIKIKKVHCP